MYINIVQTRFEDWIAVPDPFVSHSNNWHDEMIALQKTAPAALSDDLERMVARANRVSSYLKAFSHESRLLILCVLAEGEKSVTELENFLQQRQPTVSQQLARLRMDGLVSTRRNGKTIYYRLASDDIRTILSALYTVFCPPEDVATGTLGR